MNVSFFFFFRQKTAYELRISDWSSDVCASDLFDQRSCQNIGDNKIIRRPPLDGGMIRSGCADQRQSALRPDQRDSVGPRILGGHHYRTRIDVRRGAIGMRTYMHRAEGAQASPGAHVANIVVPLHPPPDAAPRSEQMHLGKAC